MSPSGTPSTRRGTAGVEPLPVSRLPGLRDESTLINASGRISHGQNCTPGKTLCYSVFTGLMPNSELCHLSEQFVLKEERRRSCFSDRAGWL